VLFDTSPLLYGRFKARVLPVHSGADKPAVAAPLLEASGHNTPPLLGVGGPRYSPTIGGQRPQYSPIIGGRGATILPHYWRPAATILPHYWGLGGHNTPPLLGVGGPPALSKTSLQRRPAGFSRYPPLDRASMSTLPPRPNPSTNTPAQSSGETARRLREFQRR